MTENFSKLLMDTKPQIQEAHRTPNRISDKNTITRYIFFKLQKIKNKENILKEVRKK